MTNPEWAPPGDSPTGPGGVGGAWQNVKTMPRWQIYLMLAVVIGGVYYYYVYRSSSSSASNSGNQDDPATQWESNARSLLLSRGYSTSEVNSALTHYLHGGTMSAGDVTLIAVAIGALGPPSYPNSAPTDTPSSPWSNPGPGQPSASTSSSMSLSGNGGTTGAVSSTGLGTWTVQSTGIGWTSSMNGIAQQFYGSTSQATQLLQANPGVVSSVYARIPLGTRVTVPRLAAN